MDTDDLEPIKPVVKAADLETMSIGALRDYIADLRSEIARAEAAIEKKQDVRSGAEALFGKR